MTLVQLMFDTLRTLVNDRVYADEAPEKAVRPYIVWQAVGGSAVNFLDSGLPSKRNARIQVAVWGADRSSVMAICHAAEDAMRSNITLQTTVMASAVATYESDTKLRGTRQDFSIWQ